MSGKREDKRVVYTKMFLKEALLQLMKEKPIDKISVTELCRRAEINRNTFYAHYDTPKSVLKEMEDELLTEIISLFPGTVGESNRMRTNTICNLVYEKRELCRVLMSDNAGSLFLEKVLASFQSRVLNEWENSGIHADPKSYELMFEYLGIGSASVIRKWIVSDLNYTPAEVADMIDVLCEGSLLALVKKREAE